MLRPSAECRRWRRRLGGSRGRSHRCTSATWPGAATSIRDVSTNGGCGSGSGAGATSPGRGSGWPTRCSSRADLDCVAEAHDGTLVSYCLAWLDPDNRAGELEPVGTHPDWRRHGLGAAVCRFALQRLREEGATRAVVYAVADGRTNPGPQALYGSIGFVETSQLLRYVRDG